MVTVIIGRDHRTNQLYRMANGKAQLIKQEKPVPTSVSKEHISLTITDDGKMILKNLNVQNYTFVNMVGVESKLIQEGDRGMGRLPERVDGLKHQGKTFWPFTISNRLNNNCCGNSGVCYWQG